jgi:hypothetical protein
MKEPRLSLLGVRVDLGWAFKLTGVLLGCVLGAQALARIGACRFTLFEAGELLVGVGTILLLRPPYQLAAVSFTLAAAAVVGIMRTLNVVLHALIAGEGIPSVSGGYLFRALVYGVYLLGYWYVNRVAENALERSQA